MEELSECPICGENKFTSFLNCKDYTVSNEIFSIISCSNCNFKFTNPRPDKPSIGKYYESENYISHSNTRAGIINKIYHLAKKRAINQKIKMIEALKCSNKTILDIGCGTGTFLGQIKECGWAVTGIEPNEKAKQLAIKDFSIKVIDEEQIIELNKGSFSIITMWHVLEHVHDLKKRLSEINNLLEKNGFAVIAVPNYTSWDANHFKEKWAAYDLPRHLSHFSPDVIKKLFKEFNLFHLKSIPMKMDSFYVSMLSEKYKKSNLSLIKAFLCGLYSNLYTNGRAEKYSSVIYIFQKD